MELRLLGHLEWRGSDGLRGAVPGLSSRAVLAMLGLRAGEVILTDEIIDGIWSSRLPHNPDAALQVVMSRLRRALGGDRDLLVHVRGGYRLAVEAAQVDAGRARLALDSGRSLARAGNLEEAERALSAGLGEWRHDSPLAEFADHPFAPGASAELIVLRAELVHACNDASLRLGRAEDVVARTERILALDPWREDLVAQQMTALGALGRRAEALGVYTALASVLRADFGAEPSAQLQALQEELGGRVGSTGAGAGASARVEGGEDAELVTRSIRTALAELVQEESDPLIRCRLELALGQAEQLAGLTGWQETLRRAAETARDAHDPAAAARCALAGTFGWTITPGQPDAARLEDLRRAVSTDSLPDELRARVLAAYALELAFSAPLGRRLSLTSRALRIATGSGQPALLLWVLNHRFNAIWAPETLPTRRRESEAACLLAERTGHLPAQAMAAGFAMATAVESGDLPGVDRHLARFEDAARQLGWPVLAWGVSVHSGWRAVLAGDLERAEGMAECARLEGERGGRPEAGLVHTSQIAGIRWLQGRLGEELGDIDALIPMVPGMRAMHAVGLLQSDRVSEAVAALNQAWSCGAIGSLPRDQLYLASLAQWAEVAAVAGATDVTAGIYAMLLPHQRQFIFTGAAVYGPVAGPLAALARTLGDSLAAERHADQARQQCAAMEGGLFADRLARPSRR